MLRLTEQIGTPVLRADGSSLGSVVDFTLRIHDGDTFVVRLAVGRRSKVTHLIAWDMVDHYGEDSVRLTPEAGSVAALPNSDEGPIPLADDELLLVRDVLDTQIVDVDGRRLVRIGDVVLAARSNGLLQAVAVDVGLGSVFRRLGLRRVAQHFSDQSVAWDALHLTAARGHEVQLATRKAIVHRLDATELAMLLSALSTDSAIDVITSVDPALAADALLASDDDVSQRLVHALSPTDSVRFLASVPEPDAARLRKMATNDHPRRRLRRHQGWNRRVHRPRHRPHSPHLPGTPGGPRP